MIVIMLPAYNEAENLGALTAKIAKTMDELGRPYRVLVVDDGSTDGTDKLVQSLSEKYPLDVYRHPENRGLAQTLFDGLAAVVQGLQPGDAVVVMDADNTHEPRHIASMLTLLDQGRDVVIASRYQPGGQEIGLTLKRKILSRGINLMLKLLFPAVGVWDYTCGFRAYRADVLQRAMDRYGDRFVEATTFAASAEILLKLRALHVSIGEVPLVLRYDQKGGLSKMQIKRTVLNYLWVIWRLKFSPASRPAGEARHRMRVFPGVSKSTVKGESD